MESNNSVFGKINYILMAAGAVLLLLGYFIMTQDSEPYGFGFAGLTLGPIVVMIGFVVELVAILYKGKTTKEEESETEE